MTPKASRRFLLVALGLSLAVHALFLAWLRSPLALRQEQATTVTIVRARVARISQATPPPRTPAPRPTSKAHAIAPPRITARPGRGPVAVATPAPATPVPTATPALASAQPCRTPNAPAGLSATPAPPEIPVAARGAATAGTTTVLVRINADGSIASAAVSATSGNVALDGVALSMAKGASYAPAYKDCKAVASEYAFAAKWAPW